MEFSPRSLRAARGRMPSGQPNPVDVHVGARVRLRRIVLGLSQERLAEALGLTFQQVQKYERGTNRIGASRLWDLSRVLEVPVSHFFEEMDDAVANQSPRCINNNMAGEVALCQHLESAEVDAMYSRETLDLVRAYMRIDNQHVRRRVYDLTRVLSSVSMIDVPERKLEESVERFSI